MSIIEQLRGRWSSFNESDIEVLCELLSEPDVFDERFSKYVCGIDEHGSKSFDFRGLCINNKVLKGGFFTGMDISYVIFSNCKIVDTVFEGATINGCIFENCEIIHSSFSNCAMPNGVFKNVSINGCFMNLLDLSEGLMQNSKVIGTNMGSANLSSCVLQNISGEDNFLYNTQLPASEKNNNWWRLTPEKSISWC